MPVCKRPLEWLLGGFGPVPLPFLLPSLSGPPGASCELSGAILAEGWVGGREGVGRRGRASRSHPLPCQPFVRRPARQGFLGRRCGGTPFVPTPSTRYGAQWRARAAPLGAGTGATRTHADPPLGGEHGEHGEDPPLARSEHRGTSLHPCRGAETRVRGPAALRFSTVEKGTYRGKAFLK